MGNVVQRRHRPAAGDRWASRPGQRQNPFEVRHGLRRRRLAAGLLQARRQPDEAPHGVGSR